ncbi:MAG: DsbA family oxidoreductase [bacterium]
MPQNGSIDIDIWSDLVCPWCWIGKHRLERALEAEGLRGRWRFHAYELGPREQKREPTLKHLAEKYSVGPEEARQMVQRVQDLGRELGLDINPDKQQTAPTYDAQRLVQAAQAHETGDARILVERLHKAHFSEGLDLGDHAVLKRIASEAGMAPNKVDHVLASDAYAIEVEYDEERASAIEIGGVPFTVLNQRLTISGAQGIEAFRKALHQALPSGV